MSTQIEKFTAIADKIREKTGTEETMTANDFVDKIDDVYASGKQAYSNEFWHQLQNSGKPMNYFWLFAYNRFTDNTYTPLYDIILNSSTNAGQNLFYSSALTDTKVAIYANEFNINGMFYWARKMETIRKLVVSEAVTYTSTFNDCLALKNIIFEGTIGKNIDLHWSTLLTKASITSIINALSETTKSLTLTLSETAVNNAFETSEWEALVNTKTNWTISLI